MSQYRLKHLGFHRQIDGQFGPQWQGCLARFCNQTLDFCPLHSLWLSIHRVALDVSHLKRGVPQFVIPRLWLFWP
ncbi:Uncharacterised protein [Vibrio cholerae]|nr:Uncharacterised protein [Vibrio cholerae]